MKGICGKFEGRDGGDGVGYDGHEELFPLQHAVVINGKADEGRRGLDGNGKDGVPIYGKGSIVRGDDVKGDGEFRELVCDDHGLIEEGKVNDGGVLAVVVVEQVPGGDLLGVEEVQSLLVKPVDEFSFLW